MLAVSAIVGGTAPAIAAPCELNVWAESQTPWLPVDPQSLDAAIRSKPWNLLDPAQRLHEMNAIQLISSLDLPADTKVFIHTETRLRGKQAEQDNNRLSPSNAICYMDWTFRPDSSFGPTPSGSINALVIRNYGQLSFYSVFKAYGSTGGPYLVVKSLQAGRLPVISLPRHGTPTYDTANATGELVQGAAKRIRNKLNGQALGQIR